MAASHFSQLLWIIVDHALQTLDGSEDGKNLVEAAGYLIKETDLDLVEVLVHFEGGLWGFLSVPGEKLFGDLILFVEVECGYVFVASGG